MCPVCSQQCGATTPFALENYVAKGLQQEWIPSWNDDSLKAGAVAYRTYGAYFVQHPGRSGSSNYDIRSDACNQGFVPVSKPAASTSSAASATDGVALTSDGTTAYFSEYASNTTGFGACTSGQTGDGTSSWPCMADPIAFGTTGNGHGRGMSQFGSHWWASGINPSGNPGVTYPRKWQCILDHYYNDNGNTTGEGTGLRTAFINGPGGDGPIAFVQPPGNNSSILDIYSMNIDATSVTRLTNDRTENIAPNWWPGGSQLAFWSPRNNAEGIWKMNPDGSGETLIKTVSSGVIGPPNVSPLGDKIAFVIDWEVQPNCPNRGQCLSIMNADGTGEVDFNLPVCGDKISWSPDETRLVYTSGADCFLHTVNADGSGDTVLYLDATRGPGAFNPSWSPDGTKIAFDKSETTGLHTNGIYIINSDGTSLSRLTDPSDSSACDCDPSWSADGRTIVFQSNRNNTAVSDTQLFSVDVASFNVTLLNSGTDMLDPDSRCCGRFDRF